MKQILLRLIIFTVTVAASTTLNAATDNNPSIIKHEVKRGETLESIAAQYGISPSEIENLNPYTRCYTGIILDIPVSSSMQEIEENKKIALNSDYYNGQLYLDRKDYKKSIECYSKIINQGDATLIAYYNRGVAWYNNGKLRQAMDDFSHVMRYDNLGRFPDAKSLYDNAYSRQAQRDAAKAQMWGDFIGTLATTAATVYVAVEQNKKQSKSASKSSSSSTSTVSGNNTQLSKKELDRLIDPNYAIQQMQKKEMEEYQMFCRYNKKADGSNYTLNEYRALQGAAIQMAKENGYDILAEQKKQIEENKKWNDEQRQKDKENWFANYGYDLNSSSNSISAPSQSNNSTTSSTSTDNSYSEQTKTNSQDTDSGPKLDSKQQFKSDPVSSEDYQRIKTIELYYRDGGNAKKANIHAELCKKGAYKYVKIGNKYFPRMSPNWIYFNNAIVYGGKQLYYND